MVEWVAKPHQVELGQEALEKLREFGLVYLAMEERTGKAITSLVACENSIAATGLIVTKKGALEGWNETLNNFNHLNSYDLVNYHSIDKLARKNHEIAILDEAHKYISGYPKPSGLWKTVRGYVYGLPIIYSSATPHAQGPQLLYHQLALSKWSPWAEFKDFYAWYEHYAERDKAGRFQMVFTGGGRQAVDYTKINAQALKDVQHLFITATRKELGFEQEPNDVIHFVELSEGTRAAYNYIIKHKLLEFTHGATGHDYVLVCDSPIKLRTSLHMLEGGGLKIENDYIELDNQEKISYILERWGDTSDLAIMYQYIVEGHKLAKVFKNARILQGQRYAEGVDLSGIRHLVIYSQDFSTAGHTQRRARQANMYRKDEIDVHFLLVKKAVSEQVYKTVSVNKQNFVDSVFEREEL